VKKILLLLLAILTYYGMTHTTTNDKPIVHTWTVSDSKAYARDALMAWQQNQYKCLVKLWDRESNWRPQAYNKHKVMGKNAGGIPQLLGMSTKLPAPLQIDRGIDYILNRYGTPCMAWKFHQRKGWY
jgi:hypothetical protein